MKNRQTTFRLGDDLLDRLRAIAVKEGRSLSNLIRQILLKYLGEK